MQRFKNIILQSLKAALLLLAVCVFLLSVSRLSDYWKAKENSEKSVQKLAESAIKNVDEYAPISVDVKTLKSQNKDIVAWLYCEDTPINYPIMQAKDNSYYINRLSDGQINPAGSLFADFRNKPDFSDVNTIIYGHNMKNNTMFGSVIRYKKQEYFDKHPFLYLFTEDKIFKVELFSGFTVDAQDDIYDLPMPENKGKSFAQECLLRSDFKSKADFSADSKFVTLSTCSYDYTDARYVVVGLLKEITA